MPGRGRPFQPGQSGNPNGRPKRDREIEELTRQHTPEVIAALVGICSDPKAPPAARVAAATAILDRGWGKPRQHLEHSGEMAQRYVVYAPPPVASTEEWLERYAPKSVVEN
jgi:Family of unknown function (DUF5681)